MRFIGMVLFFVLSFAAVALRRLAKEIGAAALGLGGLIALLGEVAIWALWRHRRATRKEPQDREEDIPIREVPTRLRSGQLSPQDLVYEKVAWSTLLDSAQFGEAAQLRQDVITRWDRVRLGIAIAIGVAAALGLVVAFSNIGEIFRWLTDDV